MSTRATLATAVLNNPVELNAPPTNRLTANRLTTNRPGFLSRSHILESTRACFAEHGYDGTTLRAIAKRLGCSVGAIYRYFADKRELLLACGSAVFEPLLEATRQRQIEPGPSMATYIKLAAEHDTLYRLLFWLSATGADEQARGAHGEAQGVPPVVRRLLQEWERQREGAARQWATAHGLLMLGTSPRRIADELQTSDASPLPTPVDLSAPADSTDEADDVTLL